MEQLSANPFSFKTIETPPDKTLTKVENSGGVVDEKKIIEKLNTFGNGTSWHVERGQRRINYPECKVRIEKNELEVALNLLFNISIKARDLHMEYDKGINFLILSLLYTNSKSCTSVDKKEVRSLILKNFFEKHSIKKIPKTFFSMMAKDILISSFFSQREEIITLLIQCFFDRNSKRIISIDPSTDR